MYPLVGCSSYGEAFSQHPWETLKNQTLFLNVSRGMLSETKHRANGNQAHTLWSVRTFTQAKRRLMRSRCGVWNTFRQALSNFSLKTAAWRSPWKHIRALASQAGGTMKVRKRTGWKSMPHQAPWELRRISGQANLGSLQAHNSSHDTFSARESMP